MDGREKEEEELERRVNRKLGRNFTHGQQRKEKTAPAGASQRPSLSHNVHTHTDMAAPALIFIVYIWIRFYYSKGGGDVYIYI